LFTNQEQAESDEIVIFGLRVYKDLVNDPNKFIQAFDKTFPAPLGLFPAARWNRLELGDTKKAPRFYFWKRYELELTIDLKNKFKKYIVAYGYTKDESEDTSNFRVFMTILSGLVLLHEIIAEESFRKVSLLTVTAMVLPSLILMYVAYQLLSHAAAEEMIELPNMPKGPLGFLINGLKNPLGKVKFALMHTPIDENGRRGAPLIQHFDLGVFDPAIDALENILQKRQAVVLH
jgi:hypothetical protein